MLPLFIGAVALYGLLHALGWAPVLATSAQGREIDLTLAVGAAGTVLAFAL